MSRAELIEKEKFWSCCQSHDQNACRCEEHWRWQCKDVTEAFNVMFRGPYMRANGITWSVGSCPINILSLSSTGVMPSCPPLPERPIPFSCTGCALGGSIQFQGARTSWKGDFLWQVSHRRYLCPDHREFRPGELCLGSHPEVYPPVSDSYHNVECTRGLTPNEGPCPVLHVYDVVGKKWFLSDNRGL